MKNTLFNKYGRKHMSRRLFTMVSAVVGAVGTIAVAVVTYCNPVHAVAINASIGIAVTAVIDIMAQFVREDAKCSRK